jgi:hypothetical protein
MKSFLHSIHLKDSPGPLLGDQIIEFADTINVFYGLNGSGKTSLIRTIAAGLAHMDFESQSEFKDYAFYADFMFPILDENLFSFPPIKLGGVEFPSHRADDRWDWETYPKTFTHEYSELGPHFMSEIKFDICDSVIGYPATEVSDEYIFPGPQEFNDLETHLEIGEVDFWLQGNPLIHFSPLENQGNKRFEISIAHIYQNMNIELKKKWDEMIEDFIIADQAAAIVFPEDDDGDHIKKQNDLIDDQVTQKYVMQNNAFLNSNNFLFKRPSEHHFSKNKKILFLPSLGYTKFTKTNLIYENNLFKDQDKSKNSNIDAITVNYFTSASNSLKNNIESLESESEDFGNLVNEIYAHLLFGAPTLAFLPNKHQNSALGNIYCWYFKNGSNDNLIPINQLSLAQYRWAELSIKIAALSSRTVYYNTNEKFIKQTLVIDEPESALHITAQQHLVLGLEWLAENKNFQIFISTHSPLFMNFSSGKLFEVRSEEKGSQVYPLDQNLKESMTQLGIEPVDLLRRISTFLVVEGQHELDVFKELFAEELERKRIHLLPLRGASNLSSIVNSSFIFDFSEAKIAVLLDNLEIDLVQKIWNDAIEMTDKNELAEAKKYVLKNLPAGDRIENKFLREFMNRVLEENLTERIQLFGMSKKDIIEYLPANYFISGANWVSLTQEFKDQKEEKDFKKWLVKKYKADFSSENIRKAVQEMDSIHTDLTNLINNL